MSDKDNDGLQDKTKALELLRDEAQKLGMSAFGRLGEEKLAVAIKEFKAQAKNKEAAQGEIKPVEEVEKPKKAIQPYWKSRGKA